MLILRLSSLFLLIGIGLSKLKIVCYWVPNNNHKFGSISDIDVNVCTHVHYAYLTLDATNLKIKFGSNKKEAATLRGYILGFKSRNRKLKVVATLGGWNDSGDGKYGRLVLDSALRKTFVKQAVEFMNLNYFDGLDLHYEYPGCPWVNCDQKYRPEKAGFASLLKELKTAFNGEKRKLSVSVAVNPGQWLTDIAYDYPTMASVVDYIVVMCYDQSGPWMTTTGHHSAFGLSTYSINFWASTGVPKTKLVMAIPFYGIVFALKDPKQNGLGAPTNQTAEDMHHMQYPEICLAIQQKGWAKVRTPDGPIAYKGYEWVGYDDPVSSAQKAKWIKHNGFGGIAVWEVCEDDTEPKCCKIKRPLINAISYGFNEKGLAPKDYGCPSDRLLTIL